MEFPSQWPNSKGKPSRALQWQVEAYQPIFVEAYVPNDTPYVKEEVLLESNFNKGKYASSMKQRRGTGYEYPGAVPQYFQSSSLDDKYRGWISGSNSVFPMPYWILDNTMDESVDDSDDNIVLLDEDGNFVVDGVSGSATVDSHTLNTGFKRDGKPSVFEIKEISINDKESLIQNKVENSISLGTWHGFLSKITEGKEIRVNELTVSMDDFSRDESEHLLH